MTPIIGCRLALLLALGAVVGAGAAFAQTATANELIQQVLAAPPEEQAALQNNLLTAARPLSESLATLAEDPQLDAGSRALAYWFVGESADPVACEQLVLPASENPPGLVFAAALGLARCGQVESLRGLLRHDDPVLRLKAAVTLGILFDTDALADIRLLGDDPGLAGYRVFIDVACGLLGDAQTEPVLRALLTERTFRDHAAIALARMGDTSVAFELGFAFRSADPMIREAAVQAAARSRTGNAESLLEAALTDPSARLADWAGRASRWYSHGRLPDGM